MLLCKDDGETTAWHFAAHWGELDLMQKIWELAEEKLTTEEIKNEILLRTDHEGTTAWHRAAYGGELEVMQKIMEWAGED